MIIRKDHLGGRCLVRGKHCLSPTERLRRAFPMTVCWGKERVQRRVCGSPVPHFTRRLVLKIRSGRSVIQVVTIPVHRFRLQGFSRRKLNVGKEDRHLDARGEPRVLDDG